MILQPFLMLAVIRHQLSNFGPKSAGMVALAKVNQLMDDDVVDDKLGCHHQPPIEVQGTFSAAGTPTRARAGDADLSGLKRMAR